MTTQTAQSNSTPAVPAKPWYSVQALTPLASAMRGAQAAAEIFIYGDIGESWYGDTTSAAQFVTDIAAIAADQIDVRMNSYGGSVSDGIAIHNAIKRHTAHVTVHIDGIAASIASLIAMAGDTVRIAENAMLMVHAPWGHVAGNAAELREYADMLDTWAQAMATSYASKSGMPVAEVLALLQDGKDHWYTAQDALTAGFADEVITAAPTAASALAALDLSRFRDLPAALAGNRTRTAPAAHPTADAPQAQHLSPVNPLESSMTKPAGTPDVPSASGAIAGVANPAQQPAAVSQSQIEAAAQAALARDQERRDGISAAFAKFAHHTGVPELQAALQRDPSATVETASTKLLAHLAKDAEPVAGGRIITVSDQRDVQRTLAVSAMCVRAGLATPEDRARMQGNRYAGMTLLEMARASLAAAGVHTEGMDKLRVVASAFTQGTSDFPILLENAMYKTLQTAYGIAPDTWSRFCKRGSVSDFRVNPRYRVGSLSNLDSKTELGEFKNKSIPDGEKASIQAGTKGNLINISREAIINDDLGAFVGLADMLGRAAKRTVEADVYATLALNSGMGPTLSDGVTLFHASHSNVIASGSAPTVLGFDAMRVLLAQQKDVSGNDYLDLLPAIWLGPIGLGGAARVVVNSTYDPDSNNKLQRTNIAAGMVRDIVDSPRLSGNPYYMFADPNVAPVLEVAFLDGNDQPYLELENGFDVDGARYKVRLDYGVAGVDFRGAVRNAGA